MDGRGHVLQLEVFRVAVRGTEEVREHHVQSNKEPLVETPLLTLTPVYDHGTERGA